MNDLGYTCVKRMMDEVCDPLIVDGIFKWFVVDRYGRAVEGEKSHYDYEPARARAEELTAQTVADRIQEQAR